jgi:hypothetical protein
METKDVIPITNYYKAMKIIKNVESNSIGVKSPGKNFIFQWTKSPLDFLMIFQIQLVELNV